MAIKDRKELFIWMLSDLTQSTERAGKILQEIGQVVQDNEIKQAIEARTFIANKAHSTLQECFKMLGAQPVKPNKKLQEVFVEDFRRELNEIQSPEGKRLYVLATISAFHHLHMGELEVLIAAAELSGNHGVGVLLETLLAEKVALADRNRRFVRQLVRERVAQKAA